MKSEYLYAATMAIAVTSITMSVSGSGTTSEGTPDTSEHVESARDTVSFSKHILPILQRACQQCHGGVGVDGEVVVEEGLDMTSYEKLMAGSLYGTVIEPGNPDESYLVELIVAGDMPKEGDALSPQEIELITQWIAGGALEN